MAITFEHIDYIEDSNEIQPQLPTISNPQSISKKIETHLGDSEKKSILEKNAYLPIPNVLSKFSFTIKPTIQKTTNTTKEMEPIINSTPLKNKKQKNLHNTIFQKDTMFCTNSPSSTSTFEATKAISIKFNKNLTFPKFDTSTLITPSNNFKINSTSSSTKAFRFNEKYILIQ
jgi:hypothetical protein